MSDLVRNPEDRFSYNVAHIRNKETHKYNKPLAILCSCISGLVSDLVGNPDGRFSHDNDTPISVSQALQLQGGWCYSKAPVLLIGWYKQVGIQTFYCRVTL